MYTILTCCKKMCYSASASLRSYLATNALLLLLLLIYGLSNTYLIWHITFVATFSMIQLAEYYIWCSLYADDKEANRYWTATIPTLLWLQPLVQTIGYLTTDNITTINQMYITLAFIFFYVVNILVTFVQRNHKQIISQVGPNGHLVWTPGRVHSLFSGIAYMLGMFVPLLMAREYLLLAYGTLSFIYSRVVYPIEEFSSMWCFIAIGYTICLILQTALYI